MIKVFSSPFKVTQEFGVNQAYYSQFGLIGHEGLDIVPTGSDWSIFSLPFKGIVVRDIDMGEKGGNYGVTCTIWYPDLKEAWQYCHLKTNTVYLNQEIEPGYYLGQMGNSGNTTGPHLHLNRFKVDSQGYRLDKNNGYLGGIDPLPFLNTDVQADPNDNISLIITDQTRIPQIDNMEVQAIRSMIAAIRQDAQSAHDRVGELDHYVEKYNNLQTEFGAYKKTHPEFTKKLAKLLFSAALAVEGKTEDE